MRHLALLLLLAIAACGDAPDDQFKLVTVEGPEILGLSLRELPRETLRSVGLGYGLGVIKLGTYGERAGLRLGDVVYGVNQKRVNNLEEFSKAIAQSSHGRLGLLVRRGKTDLYVPMDTGMLRPPDGMPKSGRPSTETLLRT